jgi:uncharacterized membrane protein
VREFAEWLFGTGASAAIHSTPWLVRLLQAVHLLGAGVVAASGVMIALRVLGRQRADEAFEAVSKRFTPWLAWGLVAMAATGIAQTLGDPVRELTATSYWVKLALLAGCVIGTRSLVRAGRRPQAFSAAAKLTAAWLIFSWLAIALLGRMIGYDLAIWGSLSLRT